MTPATALTNELTAAISKAYPGRLSIWRNNTGSGIGWSSIVRVIALIKAGRGHDALELLVRPVKFGLPGSGDLVGFIRPSGRFLSIEVKAGKDQVSDDQESFAHLVQSGGGLYLVCRSVAQCIAELGLALR